MPPARSIRQRAVHNENDENNGSVRLTRAKAASLAGTEEVINSGAIKKALQTKKSGTNTISGAPTQRRRAALGDVSNVAKNDVGDGKDGKKSLVTKSTGTLKAAQNAGIQKLSRTTSSRSMLGPKDNNKKTAAGDLKRPASGSGVGGINKKRLTSSSVSQQSTKQASLAHEDEVAKKSDFAAEVERRTNQERRDAIKAGLAAQAAIDRQLAEQKEAALEMESVTDDEVRDLDIDDHEDPLMVAEYAVEIFEYLRELEQTTMPNEKYMEHQDHLDWNERDVLNDWLIQVHQKFQLLPETLYLTINIIDRFLSAKIVQLEKLQLVGITAMFIASKYEEVMSPHVSNFSYIAKDYADSEILSAERFVLSALNYDLSYPNPMNFLRRISKADDYDIQTRTLGKYLLEISVLDQRFMEFCPSHIAAAAMYMSRLILEKGPWDATIAHYAGYTEEEILPVFTLMVDYCSSPVKHHALHNKYASKKYLKASLLVRQWAKKYYPMYLECAPSINSNPLNARDIKTR